MDENTIVVTDELGNEVEYEILFTFENEENGHQYVVYFDPEKDEPEAQAAIFDDEGGLFPIETPEEWEMVEESEENTYFDLEYYFRTYKRK